MITIRHANREDKNAMLTSFKPLFKDWDYLPLVIDDWLASSSDILTWLAIDEDDDNKLIAMAQAYEIEPGDWYLRGLRSNPGASPSQNGIAVLLLTKRIKREIQSRGAKQARYGTLEYFNESLRLASILGFSEHFRLAHNHHQLSQPVKESDASLDISVPDNPDTIYSYLTNRTALRSVENYFFTWWDTRILRRTHLADAALNNLSFQVRKGDEITGAAMYWHVPWQKSLVLSIMEGSDDALIALFNKAMERTVELGCRSFGLVYPSLDEMNRRQTLFGLPNCGCYTVQLIHK